LSAPVQRGPGDLSGYAPSRARQRVTAGASTALPLQEFPAQIETPLGDDRHPAASPGMPSSRDASPSCGGMSLRDALSSREGPASWNALPSRDAPPLPPTLFPRDGLDARETTSLRDSPLSRDAALPPASFSKGDLISGAGPHSLPDDAVDLGLAPPEEAISRREAGLSRVSGTGSASAADTAWKPKKRSLEVFEGDAALKELRSRLAAAPADQTPEPPLALAKTSIFAWTARLMLVVLAAGGALGFLWVNRQAGQDAAPVSMRAMPRPEMPRPEMPRPAAQSVAIERAPGPLADTEQAAGAALYQDFLKWRQLQGR